MGAELSNTIAPLPEVLPPDQHGWKFFATEGHRNATVVRLVSNSMRVLGLGLLVAGSLAFLRTVVVTPHTSFREAAVAAVKPAHEELRARAIKVASAMPSVPAEAVNWKDRPANQLVYSQDTEITDALRKTGKLPHDLPVDNISRKDWLAGKWSVGNAAVWQPNDKTIFVGAYTDNNEYKPGRWVQVYRKGVDGNWYSRGLDIPNTWTIEGGETSPIPGENSTLKPSDIAMTITGED